MSLQNIPINKIRITENHRTNIDKTNLDELMQSIKQHGLMQPVGVAPDKNGGFILRFGQRRFLACKKLGYQTIEAMVSGETGEEKLLLENLTENMQRKDPSFAEIGRVINRLEKMNLTTAQIAVRLGIPVAKIRQIVEVYKTLPEKLRRKVMFMEKGGGRKSRKGCIPAQVATKIIAMKREHGLNEKAVESLFNTVVEKGMDNLDLANVGDLMGGGMTAQQPLENAAQYGVYAIDVVAKHSDVSMLMEKHRLINRAHLFKKAIYGEIPPIPKPDFVFTGLQMEQKIDKKIDKKPFWKIRVRLVEFAKAKMLTETQVAALKSTDKVPVKDWSEEQCNQLKSIYESYSNKNIK